MKNYNKDTFVKNIEYLIKRRDVKIGDLETAIGVSPGYISRLKNTEGYPSGDILVSLSDYFDYSIDCLVFSDISIVSNDELLIIDFLKKMINDTQEHKTKWEKLKKSKFLDEQDTQRLLPIFEEKKDEEGKWVEDSYSSMFVDDFCLVNSDIWVYRNKGAHLYLIPISQSSSTNYEMYMFVDEKEELFKICRGDKQDDETIFVLLSSLLNTLITVDKQVSIDDSVKDFFEKYVKQ